MNNNFNNELDKLDAFVRKDLESITYERNFNSVNLKNEDDDGSSNSSSNNFFNSNSYERKSRKVYILSSLRKEIKKIKNWCCIYGKYNLDEFEKDLICLIKKYIAEIENMTGNESMNYENTLSILKNTLEIISSNGKNKKIKFNLYTLNNILNILCKIKSDIINFKYPNQSAKQEESDSERSFNGDSNKNLSERANKILPDISNDGHSKSGYILNDDNCQVKQNKILNTEENKENKAKQEKNKEGLPNSNIIENNFNIIHTKDPISKVRKIKLIEEFVNFKRKSKVGDEQTSSKKQAPKIEKTENLLINKETKMIEENKKEEEVVDYGLKSKSSKDLEDKAEEKKLISINKNTKENKEIEKDFDAIFENSGKGRGM